ncbi:hypothetical protein Zmor_003183 [Zophobas morio]|uniref:Uncharacterized protein n=1 Tax=Zophobas morio TaxID=2755281 RepID=A0AA38M121_9CUCU|nr:hypothetical protein Zmor_003183 [Zophobas morio]
MVPLEASAMHVTLEPRRSATANSNVGCSEFAGHVPSVTAVTPAAYSQLRTYQVLQSRASRDSFYPGVNQWRRTGWAVGSGQWAVTSRKDHAGMRVTNARWTWSALCECVVIISFIITTGRKSILRMQFPS